MSVVQCSCCYLCGRPGWTSYYETDPTPSATGVLWRAPVGAKFSSVSEIIKFQKFKMQSLRFYQGKDHNWTIFKIQASDHQKLSSKSERCVVHN